ncbi:uncharacterized protein LOC115438739 [Sphaeramia orbicularis]|uniref:uncharacterized protein LOC115438739 n=1 Tax=Sphaeramia orbicularis TaxID=375764 RepID=UPI00117CFBEC|nr:uncharacterized protein LOC115438739 [Sphaeramia orbicularis]
MADGHFQGLITFFSWNALLLLGVCFHDVEAVKCKQRSGKVGETVVLSSDLPPEGVSSAYWKYDNFTIADKDDLVSEQHPFLGRVDLNLTDYSLTIRKLTVHDSGNFTFLSLVNDEQRESVCITLQVQEVLSEQPELNIINLDWHLVNESCTFGLQCSSPSHRSVSYKWTVKNQTQSGPTLHFVLRPQDGYTTVTCIIFNSLSEKSASKTLWCGPPVKPEVPVYKPSTLSIALVCSVLLTILPLSLLCWCKRIKIMCCTRVTEGSVTPQTINQNENTQQIYSSLLHGDLSVYESVSGSRNTGDDKEQNEYNNLTSQSHGDAEMGGDYSNVSPEQ